ncbi:MAG: polymer-forming cytoskeletal protein [Candidatus Eisenbacteria sp.]|nr:polymer-forming cytoskeletal protein [Candidatus Eisenbacteria bacterium]
MFRKEERGEIRPAADKTTTIIGSGTHFNGILRVNGSLRVDGEVEGQIQVTECLTVGSTGVLKAELATDSAVIAGRIKGRVWAKGKVVLQRGARLEGDVHAMTFKIEDGAFFQGNCAMGADSKLSSTSQPGVGPGKDSQSYSGALKVIGN